MITRNYWWPGITKDVRKYVKGCDVCQRIKNRTEASVGKLITNKVPKKVWTHLMVDFITKLPLVAERIQYWWCVIGCQKWHTLWQQQREHRQRA